MSTFPAGATVAPRSMELEWNDLRVILAICRGGSLSGAARILGQNHSTIFRKINAIEKKTGVRFFERMADGYRMTDAGATAQRYAEKIETEVHALGREVLGQDTRLQGNIKVTAPEGFTVQLAPRLFAEFCRTHPEVSIEILGASAALDLSRREADVAIRATPKPPDTSLGKKIGLFSFALYAANSHLKRNVEVPISEQKWVLITGSEEWLVPLVWKKKSQGEQQTVFSSSNAIAVLNAAAVGMGVTMMPCYLADTDKRLTRVSELIQPLSLELWILTHPDLRHTVRVKVLMDFLVEKLRQDAALFSGERPCVEPQVTFSV